MDRWKCSAITASGVVFVRDKQTLCNPCHMLRQCSRLRSHTRFGLVKTRGFALVNSRTRLARLRPLAIGATALGGYAAYTFWTREEDEIELPAVPEPTPHFQHPYETWPWYQKAWFAFKRSVSCLKKLHLHCFSFSSLSLYHMKLLSAELLQRFFLPGFLLLSCAGSSVWGNRG